MADNDDGSAYLEQLWAEEQNDDSPAILASSQVLTQHQDRPTYQMLASANPVVTTILEKTSLLTPRVLTPQDATPARGYAALATAAAGPAHGAAGASGRGGGALQRQLDSVIGAIETYQTGYEDAVLTARKASELVRSMEAELGSLEEEESELCARVPVPADRLKRVRQWAMERGAALEVQRAASEGHALALVRAQAALRQSENELDFLADAQQDLSHTQASEGAEQTAVAAVLRGKELKAVAGYKQRQNEQAQKRADAEDAVEERRQNTIRAAEEGQSAATERLADKAARTASSRKESDAAIAAENARRRGAVLELKADVEESRKEVARRATLFRQLQKQKQEMQEAEFLALHEAGLNPYEVYRRRDIEKEVSTQRKAIKAKIASRQEDTAAILAEEDEIRQRRDVDQEQNRQMRLQFARDMGSAAKEEKNEKYMQKTVGVSMLDPTGHRFVQPSSVATFKTPAFGMGRADGKLMDIMTQRHPDAGMTSVLMPSSLRTPEELHQQSETLGRSRSLRNALPLGTAPTAAFDGADAGDDGGAEAGTATRSLSGTGLMGSTGQLGGTGTLGSSSRPVSGNGRLSQMGDGAAAEGADFDAADWLGDDAPPASPGEGGGQAGYGGAPSGWKELKTRALTKLEAEGMAKSKVRHKAGIGAPKTMMGRQFGGDAFMASPPAAVFEDFEVGTTYTVKLSVINKSYAKNSFKVLEIPVEYGNVMEYAYKLPGFLAPGVSADVTLTFTPHDNEDITTSLRMLADTGPFEIPIRCLTKKAKMTLSTPVLDFGSGVTLGESARRSFEIINDGALDVDWVLQRAESSSDAFRPGGVGAASFKRPAAGSPADDAKFEAENFIVKTARGMVGGYSRTTVSVKFTPAAAESSTLQLRIFFRSVTQRKLAIPPASLRLIAVGRDVPVFADRSLVDLRCCMVGHIYRDFLPVRNAGKTAMKLAVVARHDMGDSFELTPDFGFVQANDVFQLSVLFRPKSDTLSRLSKFAVPGAAPGTIEIPMRLTVPDQKLPVTFSIRAQITTSDIVFDPPTLAFGPCIMHERTGVTVKVINNSALPQTMAFLDLHEGVTMSPNDGFGYLMPGETVERTVTLEPPIPGPQNFVLHCKTLAGRTFPLPCIADGVQAGMSLSHNVLKLAATAVGDQSTVAVLLRNEGDEPAAYEFAVPPPSDLTLSPHVGIVQPHSSVLVQIDYTPKLPEIGEEEDDFPSGPGGRGSPAPSAGAGAAVAYGTHRLSTTGGPPGGRTSPSPGPAGNRVSTNGGNIPAGTGRVSINGATGAAGAAAIGGLAGPLGRMSYNGGPPGRASLSGQNGLFGEPSGEDSEYGLDDGNDVTPYDPNDWYRWREWRITCHIQPPLAGSAGAARRDRALEEAAQASGPAGARLAASAAAAMEAGQRLHLQVQTCAVQPDLVLRSPLPLNAAKRAYELDFGPVPVGQRVTRTIELSNQGPDFVLLGMEPLDPNGTFATVNALRVMAAGGIFRLLLSFTPGARVQYLEMLHLKTAKTNVCIALKGQGIAPELKVIPEDLVAKGLDFGDVPRGESRELRFSVANACPFPLTFTMQWRDGVADPNLAMRPAFFCRPGQGTLALGETQEIVVVFQPSSQRPYFSESLRIFVPSQEEELIIPLRGRCWEEGVFLAGTSLAYPPPDEDPFMETHMAGMVAGQDGGGAHILPAHMGKASTGGAPPAVTVPAPPAAAPAGAVSSPTAATTVAPLPPPPSVPRELILTLPGSIYLGESTSATFQVGSLKGAGGEGANGEVLIDELPPAAKAAGWSVDVAKQGVSAGELKNITVRYMAPARGHAGLAASVGHPEFIEVTIGATLKGGIPAPPAGSGSEKSGDGRRVCLRCRCMLLPGLRPRTGLTPPAPPTSKAAAAAASAAAKKKADAA